MTPRTTRTWTVEPRLGFDGLKLQDSASVSEPTGTQCLIRIRAVSLNYRDIAMLSGNYPMSSLREKFIPCSDAAGEVIAVGDSVTEFKIGDKVITSFFQDFEDGYVTLERRKTTLGAARDGVLREHAIFEERGLVELPGYLSFIEGATLPCAALTAWNCLNGLEGRKLKKGQSVLTQGTGGVSIFAIQIGTALGATVIATTSSKGKEKKLNELGAHHIINYKENPNWGETARGVSPDELGVHHVIEVAGDDSMPQSLAATRLEGVVSIVGFLGGSSGPKVGTAELMRACALIRPVQVGSRKQLKEMIQFFDEHKIHPVVHEKFFRFEESKAAYQCLKAQQFFGKIVIKVD